MDYQNRNPSMVPLGGEYIKRETIRINNVEEELSNIQYQKGGYEKGPWYKKGLFIPINYLIYANVLKERVIISEPNKSMFKSMSLSDSSVSISGTKQNPYYKRRVKGRKRINDKKSGFDYWQEGDNYEYKQY